MLSKRELRRLNFFDERNNRCSRQSYASRHLRFLPSLTIEKDGAGLRRAGGEYVLRGKAMAE